MSTDPSAQIIEAKPLLGPKSVVELVKRQFLALHLDSEFGDLNVMLGGQFGAPVAHART